MLCTFLSNNNNNNIININIASPYFGATFFIFFIYIIRVISPHFLPPQVKRIATCTASNRVAAEVVNNIADKLLTRRLSLKLNYRCPGVLLLLDCCFSSTVTSKVMSGRSVNLTTLFLGRLRPPKRLTITSCTYFRQ